MGLQRIMIKNYRERPQGSPLSVILDKVYNSDLLTKFFEFDGDEVSLGFIDNVVHLAAGKDLVEAKAKLSTLGQRSLAWGRSHGAIFTFTMTNAAKLPFIFDEQHLPPLK